MAVDPTYQTPIYVEQGGRKGVLGPDGQVALNGNGVTVTTDAAGHMILTNVPTVDPHVVGALWSNAGVLTLSAG